jgi:hypothetical protein
MACEPMRDPVTDPFLTPQNAALLVIDGRPSQMEAPASIGHGLSTRNIASVPRPPRGSGSKTWSRR